jgi:hypothetical protein
MPLSNDKIADELNSRLKEKIRLRETEPVMTIQWPEFYRLCEAERFRGDRLDQISKAARDTYGLLVAYGEKIVLVAHDRNFAQ